jgi:hypothetical protein
MTITAGEKLKGLVEVDLPFENYISQDPLYVDKTSYIYSMVSNVKRRFLVPPGPEGSEQHCCWTLSMSCF